MRRLFTDDELAAAHIPRTDWPVIDLATAAGLIKRTQQHTNGQRAHIFSDRRTAQSWGALDVLEAGRMGLALLRLRGLNTSTGA